MRSATHDWPQSGSRLMGENRYWPGVTTTLTLSAIAKSVTGVLDKPRKRRWRETTPRGADTHMTTPTGALRFVCRGLAAFALVALIPILATAQSSGRPALHRVTGTAIPGGPPLDCAVAKIGIKATSANAA